jgi:hypothetical protein
MDTPLSRRGGTVMGHGRLILALGVVAFCGLAEAVNAQTFEYFTPGGSGMAYREGRYEAALVVDVRPLDAQILLDGRPIGTARELMAQAIPVSPGWHTVDFVADGHYSYRGRFAADQHSSASPFVVTLVPIR